MATLGGGGAYFFRQLADNPGEELKQALWELIWAGWITGDTFAPVRAMLTGPRRSTGRRGHQRTGNGNGRRVEPLQRRPCGRPDLRADGGRPLVGAARPQRPESTVRAHFQAELLLNRYGVLTKARSGGRSAWRASRCCTRC